MTYFSITVIVFLFLYGVTRRLTMKSHGFMHVDSKGEAEILLKFRPTQVSAKFVDRPCHPVGTCGPVHEDKIDIDVIAVLGSAGAIQISWDVGRPRKIRWDASNHKR